MVLLKQLLPRQVYRILETIFTHIVMILVVGPFFFVFFYMFCSSLKPDYLFF